MASFDQHVIEMQPQVGAPVQQQQIFDDKGELILFEGICWSEGLKDFVHRYYCGLGIGCFFGLGLACCIPIGNCCANKACDTWRLYLTDKSLCFDTKIMYSPQCAYGSSTTFRIALTDIEAIQVVSGIVNAGCCGYGRKIASPTSIQVEIRLGSPLSAKCCCFWELPFVITVYYCHNANEFVEAVKKQMNTMIRD